MADTDFTSAAILEDRHSLLRHRIGWICHAGRLAIAAYAVWVLWMLVRFWTDRDFVVRGYGARLKADLSGMTDIQRYGAFGIDLGLWALTAIACLYGWRLFSNYLGGRIFTADSALQMRRLALFGLAAQGLALLLRPVIIMILSSHLPEGQRVMGFFTQPPDLLNLLFLFAILAFSQIFFVAAEIADENAGII